MTRLPENGQWEQMRTEGTKGESGVTEATGTRCFRKEEEQELLDYQTRRELKDLWVSGLGGGSESWVDSEETGRMKGLFILETTLSLWTRHSRRHTQLAGSP